MGTISKNECVQGKGGTVHCVDSRYQVWVTAYEEREISNPNLRGEWIVQAIFRGQCLAACHEMRAVFPELRLVRGWVVTVECWNSHHAEPDFQESFNPADGHFWLETDAGLVVDPTRKQFRDQHGYYVAFDERLADTLPTGKCCNCGDYCYGGRDMLCSEECERSYTAYVMRDLPRLG